jgi:DNA-binding LacI/PurR family transcriptional regulator
MVGIGGLFLPPLSTVRLPHDEIGKAAAMHIIRNRKGARVHRVACPFIGRGSF